MTTTAAELSKALTAEYKMTARVLPLSESVTLFGSEIECYRLGYKLRKGFGEYTIGYSDNFQSWYIDFPNFFDIDFAQKIRH